MSIEQQNGDYNLYAEATVFNKTADAATAGVWELDFHIGDGTKNLHTDAATLTLTVTVAGETVGGGAASVAKDAGTLRARLSALRFHVANGETVTAVLSSNNSNDTDVDVTVTPRRAVEVLTGGIAKASVISILDTALTETSAGYLAAAFNKLFDVASPVLTAASVNQTGDSYAIVGHTDYGNAKLVRSATPANSLAVDAAGKVATPDNQKMDLNTVKGQPITCVAAITVNPNVGGAQPFNQSGTGSGATLNASLPFPGYGPLLVSGTGTPEIVRGIYLPYSTSGGYVVYAKAIKDQTTMYLAHIAVLNPYWVISASPGGAASGFKKMVEGYESPYGTYYAYGAGTTGTVDVQPYWGVLDTTTLAAITKVNAVPVDSATGRPKVWSQVQPGMTGCDVFQFDLELTAADPLIIESTEEENEPVQVDDRWKHSTQHTEATTGTQWLVEVNAFHAKDWTPELGDPPITLSSSDETVATIDIAGQVAYVGDGTCEIIGESPAHGESPYFRSVVEIVNTHTGGQTVSIDTYTDDPGSVRADATAAVDSRIAVEGKLKPIYAVQNHAGGVYQRSADCWAADLDLTCISPWNSRGAGTRAGTLISPRHALVAKHYPLYDGDTIRFVNSANETITRTITAVADISAADFRVCRLDSPITDCSFARILPDNWADYLPNGGDHIPLLSLDQEEKALVTDLSISGMWVSCHYPTDVMRQDFNEQIISGDSGNPCFIIIGDKLVLLTLWESGGAGTGNFVTYFRTAIEAAMQSLGGGYDTLTQIDLSAYNTY